MSDGSDHGGEPLLIATVFTQVDGIAAVVVQVHPGFPKIVAQGAAMRSEVPGFIEWADDCNHLLRTMGYRFRDRKAVPFEADPIMVCGVVEPCDADAGTGSEDRTGRRPRPQLPPSPVDEPADADLATPAEDPQSAAAQVRALSLKVDALAEAIAGAALSSEDPAHRRSRSSLDKVIMARVRLRDGDECRACGCRLLFGSLRTGRDLDFLIAPWVLHRNRVNLKVDFVSNTVVVCRRCRTLEPDFARREIAANPIPPEHPVHGPETREFIARHLGAERLQSQGRL